MASLQKVIGRLSKTQPSRTFVDGVFCSRIEIAGTGEAPQNLERIFFTAKLTFVLDNAEPGEFYFWNSHCYAVRSEGRLVEDIEGARSSYFKRDARLLLLLAVSILFLPVSLFVSIKRLLRAGTAQQMKDFLSA